MSAEEPGKDEEIKETDSSAESTQANSDSPATAEASTEDLGTTAGEDTTESASESTTESASESTEDLGTTAGEDTTESASESTTESASDSDGNLDTAVSPVAVLEANGQTEQSAEASDEDSVSASDEADVDVERVDEQVEPEQAAAPVESEAQEPVTESPPKAEEEQTSKDEKPPKFRRGQICSGVITKTSPTAVYVDLGEGDEGLVPGRELELMTRKMLESLLVGAEVEVYVVNPRNHRGETILSINHALEELDWRKAEEFAKSKNVFEALIGGYNKGGLIVRFGRLRGFVPQSQLAEERARGMSGETPEERYSPMVNQPIGVKVMEVDRNHNRLILSERAAMREVRQRRKRELIEELSLGEIRTGTVVSLETFGAFVDIGGAEGLVHLTELAWGHITHPRQVVNVGEDVEVEVISIDSDSRRIGLSRRRVLSDPWDDVAGALRRGQLVRGRVTKLTKFGAFARLIENDAVEGLIHISELSGERVSHPRDVVKRGDELVLRIVKIDIKERRLGLSLKSVNSTEYLDLDWEMAIQESASLPQDTSTDETPAEAEAQTEE